MLSAVMQCLNIWETGCQSNIIGIIYRCCIYWDNYSNYIIHTVSKIILESHIYNHNIKYFNGYFANKTESRKS